MLGDVEILGELGHLEIRKLGFEFLGRRPTAERGAQGVQEGTLSISGQFLYQHKNHLNISEKTAVKTADRLMGGFVLIFKDSSA